MAYPTIYIKIFAPLRHGHKYNKYKMCLCIMMVICIMVICIKQHLSNIWSSIHEKVKQHWDWVEKKLCLIKKRVYHVPPILDPFQLSSCIWDNEIIEICIFDIINVAQPSFNLVIKVPESHGNDPFSKFRESHSKLKADKFHLPVRSNNKFKFL